MTWLAFDLDSASGSKSIENKLVGSQTVTTYWSIYVHMVTSLCGLTTARGHALNSISNNGSVNVQIHCLNPQTSGFMVTATGHRSQTTQKHHWTLNFSPRNRALEPDCCDCDWEELPPVFLFFLVIFLGWQEHSSTFEGRNYDNILPLGRKCLVFTEG